MATRTGKNGRQYAISNRYTQTIKENVQTLRIYGENGKRRKYT